MLVTMAHIEETQKEMNGRISRIEETQKEMNGRIGELKTGWAGLKE